MAKMGIRPQSHDEIRQALVEDAPRGRKVLILLCGAGETHIFGYMGDVERVLGGNYIVSIHAHMGPRHVRSVAPERISLKDIYRVVLNVDRGFDPNWRKAVGREGRYWLIKTKRSLYFGLISSVFSRRGVTVAGIHNWVSEPMFAGADIAAAEIEGVAEVHV